MRRMVAQEFSHWVSQEHLQRHAQIAHKIIETELSVTISIPINQIIVVLGIFVMLFCIENCSFKSNSKNVRFQHLP